MTLRLVPGGPEPMMKGLGSLSPSTVVASVGIQIFLRSVPVLVNSFTNRGYNNITTTGGRAPWNGPFQCGTTGVSPAARCGCGESLLRPSMKMNSANHAVAAKITITG